MEHMSQTETPGLNIKDRFRGAILWSAVGDAVGAPYEFRSPHNIKTEFNNIVERLGFVEAITDIIQTRSWTDDTKMTICHARSLIRQGGFDPVDTAQEFMAWVQTGDTRGIGITTANAVSRLMAGSPWHKAGKTGKMAAGNGPAMKVSPVALFYSKDLAALHIHSENSSKITHNCPEAFAGTRATAYVIAKAAQGTLNLDTIALEASAFAGPSATAEHIIRAQELVHKQVSPSKALAELGCSGYIVETVASSIYCFLMSPDRPHLSIVRAVMGGSDADTTAAVTGAISGAYNGLGALPQDWFDVLESNDALLSLADTLYDAYELQPA